MDDVLSVAFCHREFGTIEAEGSTRMCTGAFCLFLCARWCRGSMPLSGAPAAQRVGGKASLLDFMAVYLRKMKGT